MTEFFRAQPLPANRDADVSELTRNAMNGIRRNVWTIVLSALVFTALSIVFVIVRSVPYEANASLMIDPRIGSDANASRVAPTLLLNDELVVDSEIEVLRSERLLRRVAKLLPLPEPDESAPSDGSQDASTTGNADGELAGEGDAPGGEAPNVAEAQRLSQSVEWLRRQLDIERMGTTYVISLSFSADDPVLAARVVNTLAEEYIALQTQEHLDRVTTATDWLSQELMQLSATLAELEEAAENYRVKNNLPLSETDSAVIQEMAEIDLAAIEARAVVRAARSELQSIELDLERLEDPMEIGLLASAAFEDASLEAVQNQLRNVQQQASGSDAFNENRLLDGVVSRIRSELVRLRDTRKARIEVASATLEALEEEKAALEEELSRIESLQIPLRAKQREIEALREQYISLSQRLRDNQTATRFAASTARIIDTAIPPTEEREILDIGLRIIVAAFLGGTILGLGIVFLREHLDDRVRSSRDITDTLGLPYVGTIPTLRGSAVATTLEDIAPELDTGQLSNGDRQLLTHLLAGSRHGSQRFVETLRRAASALRDSDRSQVRYVLVTSPQGADGKTTFAANLAAFLAERGQDVLLVDGDPQDAGLSRILATGEDIGHATARDAAASGEAARAEAARGAATITGLSAHLRVGHASDVSVRFDSQHYIASVKSLLETAPKSGEIVLIDAGSLNSAVEDLTDLLDTTKIFLVMRFGTVSASSLRTALRQRPSITDRIVGTLVTQVSERRLRFYEPLSG